MRSITIDATPVQRWMTNVGGEVIICSTAGEQREIERPAVAGGDRAGNGKKLPARRFDVSSAAPQPACRTRAQTPVED